MGKKSLIYSGSISGIFLISYRKCLDRELYFSGPNLLLFSVFWQRLCCCRRTKSKKSLIFWGFGKYFCLFYLVWEQLCAVAAVVVPIAYWQQPRRRRAMCKKSQIYFGLNLVIFQKTSMNVFDQERGCLHPRISNLLLFSAWWQEPCNRQTICKKASNLMVSFWLFSKPPIQIFWLWVWMSPS